MDNTQRGKYQFLKTQFAPKIKAALGAGDRSAAGWLSGAVDGMSAGDIFDKFAAMDPSAQEKKKPHRYLNWIIQAYLQSHKDGAQPSRIFTINPLFYIKAIWAWRSCLYQ